MCDNTSAINISKNPVIKNQEYRDYHFLRDHVKKGDIALEIVSIKNQLADIFTKPLSEDQFIKIRHEHGMINVAP